ncbi:MAG: 2-amino-4-hydroxy-6-hydroxymethyldihydropteridine diphosphokinase [Gammaproteobacteria bacterium]
MSHAWLGIGSNVDAERNVRAALAALRSEFGDLRLSPVYRSRAVGFDGDDFINLVARIETERSPEKLQEWLRELEDAHGRQRDVPKFSDRVLDVDILLYDDRVLDRPGLQLPRPEILTFAHVLRPLAELSPELRHPLDGRTMAQLWAASDLRSVALDPLPGGWD